MATEQQIHINGNFAPQPGHGYGMGDQTFAPHAGNNSGNVDFDGIVSHHTTSATSGGNAEVPKDEVGWYFVEQYYTNLSRSPDKLFLFYNKRSQCVWGQEAEKVKVCVGQKEINDRIKDLDLQDCKVRVTNVDSQGSDKSIVIQVLGEISSKGAAQRKFAQTFVLAEQPNGYFLLNDIFRYILEDDEEYEGEHNAQVDAASGYQEPVPTADPSGTAAAEPPTLTSSEDPQLQEHDAEIVDQGLEQAIQESDAPTNAINGTEVKAPVDTAYGQETTALAPASAAEHSAVEAAEAETASEAIAAAPAVDTKSSGSAPKPAVPKTWANLVAGNRPVPTAPAAGSITQSKTSPQPPSQTAAAPPAPVTPQEPVDASTPVSSGSEWQTAGAEHGKKQPRPQATQPTSDVIRGFVKNVTENMDANTLRSALNKVTEVSYFDINRQKNCAFIEYPTMAAFQTAVAGNPYDVAGTKLYVEERRVRPQSMAGNFSGNRGAAGRGGRGTERGRGLANGRGRGNASRGKSGAAQAA